MTRINGTKLTEIKAAIEMKSIKGTKGLKIVRTVPTRVYQDDMLIVAAPDCEVTYRRYDYDSDRWVVRVKSKDFTVDEELVVNSLTEARLSAIQVFRHLSNKPQKYHAKVNDFTIHGTMRDIIDRLRTVSYTNFRFDDLKIDDGRIKPEDFFTDEEKLEIDNRLSEWTDQDVYDVFGRSSGYCGTMYSEPHHPQSEPPADMCCNPFCSNWNVPPKKVEVHRAPFFA